MTIAFLKGVKSIKLLMPRARKYLWILLALWFSIGIGWGIPGYETWAPDEVVPARMLEGLHHGFSGGWYNIYPPFHFYVMSLFYLPFLILDKLGFLNTYEMPWYGILSYVSRSVSILMGLGVLYVIYRLGRRIADRQAGLGAAAIFALTLPFTYYTKFANVDVPYLFWFMLSLYFYLNILNRMQLKDFLLFGITATLAVCTKDQAFALYVIPAFWLIFKLQMYIKGNESDAKWFRVWLDKRLLLTALTVFIVFILIHNWLLNFNGFLAHVNLITGDASKPFAEYGNSLKSHARMFVSSIRHIYFSLGWTLSLVCVAGIIWSCLARKSHQRFGWLWLFPISYYLFFISVIHYNYVRFFLPVCVVIALYGGFAVSNFLKLKLKFKYVNALVLAAFSIIAIRYAWGINSLILNDSRYEMEKWMQQHIDSESYIGHAMLPLYVPRLDNYPHHEMVDLMDETLETKKPDYLLLNLDYISRYRSDSEEFQNLQNIRNGLTDYTLVYDHYNKLVANRLKNPEILTNINKLNPHVEIYKRSEHKRTKGEQ